MQFITMKVYKDKMPRYTYVASSSNHRYIIHVAYEEYDH